MPLAVFFIMVALITYSLAIFAERITGELKIWMVIVLAGGWLSDLTSTVIMIQQAGRWEGSFHAIAGIIVLLLMFALVVLAMRVLESISKRQQFHQWAIWGWLLWVLIFISGISKL